MRLQSGANEDYEGKEVQRFCVLQSCLEGFCGKEIVCDQILCCVLHVKFF